jgi:hypothetical protein
MKIGSEFKNGKINDVKITNFQIAAVCSFFFGT